MSKKAQDFFDAFKAGRISRRELMAGAGKLGITAATANFMLNAAGTSLWPPTSTGRSSTAASFTCC